ncbi:SRPBCC family protein [Flavobacterium sp.]|uniref:SRPBCC family protein n=1 Tax=Flavobacterium sp. TaxID=239 RepID=UPI0039E6468C
MKSNLTMDFSIDQSSNSVHVKKEFDAPLATVWSAWTQSQWLDQWWAPKPWKAQTKSMDFTEGGRWLYAMVGPEGEEHWSIADYKKIEPHQFFEGEDAFTDSQGNINPGMPRMNWKVRFSKTSDSTLVDIHITFDQPDDLESTLKMGFQEGFTMGLGNLDELLAKDGNGKQL